MNHNMDHYMEHNMHYNMNKKRDHNSNHKSIHGSLNWFSILIFNLTNEKRLYFDVFDGTEGINERQSDLE